MTSQQPDEDRRTASPREKPTTNAQSQSKTPDSDAVGCEFEQLDLSTRSVTTSVFNFHKENGRTYHGYHAGSYHFPNDATEMERLEYQYLLLYHCLGEKMYLAPLPDPSTFSSSSPPFHILDIGTGTGTWAIEMGDHFPHSSIEATDLSPIQPSAVPSNVQFIIDDAEQLDWAVPFNHYDYIHTRIMLGSFESFKRIIAHAFKHTKPGGYMESQELMFMPFCDDGSMPADWPFLEWSRLMQETSIETGRELNVAARLKRWYEEAGFVDVQERVFQVPVGRWACETALKDLGHWWLENLLAGLQGFSLAYFTRWRNWSSDELEVYLVNVRRSLADRNVHAYHKMYVVWGRKPEAAEVGKGGGGSAQASKSLSPEKGKASGTTV